MDSDSSNTSGTVSGSSKSSATGAINSAARKPRLRQPLPSGAQRPPPGGEQAEIVGHEHQRQPVNKRQAKHGQQHRQGRRKLAHERVGRHTGAAHQRQREQIKHQRRGHTELEEQPEKARKQRHAGRRDLAQRQAIAALRQTVIRTGLQVDKAHHQRREQQRARQVRPGLAGRHALAQGELRQKLRAHHQPHPGLRNARTMARNRRSLSVYPGVIGRNDNAWRPPGEFPRCRTCRRETSPGRPRRSSPARRHRA